MKPVVIIGTGLAGYSLAREFRALDKETPLTLITGDGGEYYSKPMLSNALAQGKEASALVLSDAAKMERTLDARVITHTRVEAVDRAARRVSWSGGTLDYGALVMALGASPIRLPLTGSGAQEVLSVNSLDDYGGFRRRLEKARSVAIIGPGLIGCEFANDLQQGGRRVEVIGPDPYPISTLLPEAAGRALQRALEAAGVGFHLGTVTGDIDRESHGYRVALRDGGDLHADLVLSAVGLRPDTELARAAGLEVNRGIVVDRYLRAGDGDIYALGDCAEVEG
ncbi:MAG: FAD-dependent oxidoreductase, partial [Candidatus Sedimenticola endophacoides]